MRFSMCSRENYGYKNKKQMFNEIPNIRDSKFNKLINNTNKLFMFTNSCLFTLKYPINHVG